MFAMSRYAITAGFSAPTAAVTPARNIVGCAMPITAVPLT
jgi:hypothetical protein